MKLQVLSALVCAMFLPALALADTFGMGSNQFTIDFVNINHAGNAADAGGTPGCGAVGYNYRIGKYEVTNAQWNAFTSAVGAPVGNPSTAFDQGAYFTGNQQPMSEVSWYEAAQFCNYLTSGDKSKGAYQFSGNNTNPGNFIGTDRSAAQVVYGTIYVLPTEDEWYKAAYFKPDASGYSLYANGTNTIPFMSASCYGKGSEGQPWNVGTGTMEQNGTFDMMGNVYEWSETPINNSYIIRGGAFPYYMGGGFESSARGKGEAYEEYAPFGFRVASIPEPATLLLLGLGGMVVRKHVARSGNTT